MSWLSTPGAQTDPHYWAATYAGHVCVGMGLWLLCLPLGAWPAMLGAWALYAVWEAVQWRKYGATITDSLLDWDGAALGAVIAAGLWTNNLAYVIGAAIAVGIAATAGVIRRQ